MMDAATAKTSSIILFYKYHPLSDDDGVVELYRSALEALCGSLQMKGRILVGCNAQRSEGINGTLSGRPDRVVAFTMALSHHLPTHRSSQDVAAPSTIPQAVRDDEATMQHMTTFWNACQTFYERADCEPLLMSTKDFKWSTVPQDAEPANDTHSLFPDLNIKLVKELIGTGGLLADISIQETSKGYLTPDQWHEQLNGFSHQQQQEEVGAADTQVGSDGNSSDGKSKNNDTVLIDCRNTKEYQIGHFPNALNPNTTTFHQFPQWVKDHQHSLQGKKVLMYCTGGIRCEKASAYIRNTVPDVQAVSHLQGGIHKYLERYGSKGLWQGKNFVFDGRGAATADATYKSSVPYSMPSTSNAPSVEPTNGNASGAVTSSDTTANSSNNNDSNTDELVVGQCTYCSAPYDSFDPRCVCTVCREPILVCKSCQSNLTEFHCDAHTALRECYFTRLEPFSVQQLQRQQAQLQHLMAQIAVGKKFKQRRKTMQRQIQKIVDRLEELKQMEKDGVAPIMTKSQVDCRNCGEVSCDGRCWGFLGLGRKQKLEASASAAASSDLEQANGNANHNGHNAHHQHRSASPTSTVSTQTQPQIQTNRPKKQNGNNQHLRERKERERQQAIQEIVDLGLCKPSSMHRDPNTGIRVPPPCTRVVSTRTKGKWCGRSVLHVIREQFHDLMKLDELVDILRLGLLRVNDMKITSIDQAETTKLKNMDVLSRFVHWHEPPVHIPRSIIQTQKVPLPQAVIDEHQVAADDATIYVCNKPSTVPAHPAGTYFSNSLTSMVEGIHNLRPKDLIPCHRIDRVTSGLTLCCTNVQVARLVQSRIDEGAVQKLYLAKVNGLFPHSSNAMTDASLPACTGVSNWLWRRDTTLEVHGPIETVDPANGIRKITSKGKPAASMFRLIAHDTGDGTSIILCRPLTGRSHQLRVHLQWLGHPIIMDSQYDGPGDAPNKDGPAALEASTKLGPSCEASSSSVSPDDVAAVRTVCKCCTKSVSDAFSPAQLLQGGHAICLHAYRYRIPFIPKRSKKKKKKKRKMMDEIDTNAANVLVQGGGEVESELKSTDQANHDIIIGSVDVHVDLPEWACDVNSSQLTWLE